MIIIRRMSVRPVVGGRLERNFLYFVKSSRSGEHLLPPRLFFTGAIAMEERLVQ
jgi:hypothetical protein